MRLAIRHIDRALKRLYELDPAHRAEDFLIRLPEGQAAAGNAGLHGALYIHASDEKRDKDTELSLGIYLSAAIQTQLRSFGRWQAPWSVTQLNAFTVAAEEVSHFHYVLHHAQRGRQVSQLELELQGEIDKFLLAYFCRAAGFETLLQQIFERFRLAESLSEEEKTRYREANHLARRFILKHGAGLDHPQSREKTFRLLRRFYRLDSSEKISLISA